MRRLRIGIAALGLLATLAAAAPIDTWVPFGPPSQGVATLAVDAAGNIFASTTHSGVYKTADRGGSWATAGRGMGTEAVRALAMDAGDDRLVAVTTTGAFQRRCRRQLGAARPHRALWPHDRDRGCAGSGRWRAELVPGPQSAGLPQPRRRPPLGRKRAVHAGGHRCGPGGPGRRALRVRRHDAVFSQDPAAAQRRWRLHLGAGDGRRAAASQSGGLALQSRRRRDGGGRDPADHALRRGRRGALPQPRRGRELAPGARSPQPAGGATLRPIDRCRAGTWRQALPARGNHRQRRRTAVRRPGQRGPGRDLDADRPSRARRRRPSGGATGDRGSRRAAGGPHRHRRGPGSFLERLAPRRSILRRPRRRRGEAGVSADRSRLVTLVGGRLFSSGDGGASFSAVGPETEQEGACVESKALTLDAMAGTWFAFSSRAVYGSQDGVRWSVLSTQGCPRIRSAELRPAGSRRWQVAGRHLRHLTAAPTAAGPGGKRSLARPTSTSRGWCAGSSWTRRTRTASSPW